jgi:hypothetical protein
VVSSTTRGNTIGDTDHWSNYRTIVSIIDDGVSDIPTTIPTQCHCHHQEILVATTTTRTITMKITTARKKKYFETTSDREE